MTPAISGRDLARAAAALVGTPFRLNGRNPRYGLDCVGLLGAALARCGRLVVLPLGYSLHIADLDRWLPDPAAIGLVPAPGDTQAGDIILLTPGPGQVHLVLAGLQQDFIHAHAGLRRVVRSPQRPDGASIGAWRLTETESG